MKTFTEYLEARNHLGEMQYNSWNAWMKALKTMYSNVTFEGDKEIANAFVDGKGVGEWDGVVGIIYQS